MPLAREADPAEGQAEDLWEEAEAEDHPDERGRQGGPRERRVGGQTNSLPWGMIGCSHTFSLTMEMRMPLGRESSRRVRPALVALALVAALAGCSQEDPRLSDLPSDVVQARPTISAEEARFVLAARQRGVFVTGATVADDIETGTTTCWALENGGVTLGQVAVDDKDRPLRNEGDELRTKQLMAAAVESLCPDYTDQITQLKLP